MVLNSDYTCTRLYSTCCSGRRSVKRFDGIMLRYNILDVMWCGVMWWRQMQCHVINCTYIMSNEYTYTYKYTHTRTHTLSLTHTNTHTHPYTHTHTNTEVTVMRSNLARAVGRSSFWAVPLCMWLSSIKGPGSRRNAWTAVWWWDMWLSGVAVRE